MNNKSNRILIILDFSYWLYYTLFGATSEFQRKHAAEAKMWIKPPEETDQNNLPNLLMCDTFKKILKRFVMKRLETIDWQTKSNHQNEIDMADGIDIIFAMDDNLTHSFRKDIYPEYKAQRVLAKKSYNIFAIKEYITNVIFKELDVETKYDCHLLKVNGAEGDDVIACICKNLSKDYMLTILYASDHDFIQLEGIHQYNLFGQKVECKVGNNTVTPDEYLKCKILLGDGADNITKVFKGVGPTKALKLVKDENLLKEKLLQDQDAAKQYLLNEQLISFKYIPSELENKIVEEANKILYKDSVLNEDIDLKDFMNL